MAHSDRLNRVALDAIADQVGILYPDLVDNQTYRQKSAELTETFAVWFIGQQDITTDGKDIVDLAQNTGRWHSQVLIDGIPELVARSAPPFAGSYDFQVKQLIEGELAEEIAEAINWIDEYVTGNPLVRILEIPAFHLTAFWLIGQGENHVLIARIPSAYKSLTRRQLYSSKDFLRLLQHEQPISDILQ